MPVPLSYPGVYIEEIPSGVRTITGVATSITAFVGRASRGPVDEPVTITSYGDFERRFGGLGTNYPMSYSVRDFYLNGGSQAIIVRLYKAPVGPDEPRTSLVINGLTLEAKYPGSWGKTIRIALDHNTSAEMKTALGLAAGDLLFHMTVTSGDTRETFLNLTVVNSARRIDRVLKAESNLIRWKGDWPNVTPVLANTDLGDEVSVAEKALAEALAEKPPVPATIAAAQAVVDAAIAALKGSDSAALDSTAYTASRAGKTGLYALEKADLFNLLCIPPDKRAGDTPTDVYQEAMKYCAERRAMLLVDAPADWSANVETAVQKAKDGLAGLGLSGQEARNAALYFPRVIEADPLRGGQLDNFVPCGIMAGIMARTDSSRGVWKAPAGLDAAINGIQGLNVPLTDPENGILNPLGINCLRAFPVNGRVVWGARTLRGADQLADEYKYIPVRRTALFIEESLYRGTQWVVFEPNDEPLWSQIRLNLGAFMNNLFRQGAFQGKTPAEAYFVKCDKETTTQNDINLGIVNIVVGFAPLKPAEFVVIKVQQIAGQVQS
jgi:phage tail sheath protein FI